jgi:coenzyme PQQ precursor peptide PqqA
LISCLSRYRPRSVVSELLTAAQNGRYLIVALPDDHSVIKVAALPLAAAWRRITPLDVADDGISTGRNFHLVVSRLETLSPCVGAAYAWLEPELPLEQRAGLGFGVRSARKPCRGFAIAWTTPTLVEICIGLEINGYLPAEF